MYRCAGMSVLWIFRHVHLVSIDVKSEDSILFKETITGSQCILEEICRRNFTSSVIIISREG